MALVAVAMAAATNAACGSDDSSGASEKDDWGRLGPSELIEEVKAKGATAEQIAILEEARETGEISFEDYSAAIDRGLRCIRETGGRAYDHGTVETEGLLERRYSVGAEAEESDPVEFWGMTNHRCIVEHSFAVEMAYEFQPSSQEAQEAFWEEHRDALVDCLHEQGLDEVVGDESMSELKRIAADAVADGTAERDCVAEVGSPEDEAAR